MRATISIPLEQAAGRVTPISISVDPERDTVARPKDYAGLLHPRLVALTGSPAEVDAVDAAAEAHRVYSNEAEADDAAVAHLVDRSVVTYLMDPDGGHVARFGHDATPEETAARLREVAAAI